MKPLDKIKRVLYEIGLYDPDVNDKCVRIEIHTRSPHAFLNKSPDGTPTFATRDPIGTVDPIRLMRGISVAKAKYSLTGDEKYLNIADRLTDEMNNIKNKTNIAPTTYKPAMKLNHIIKNFLNLNEE